MPCVEAVQEAVREGRCTDQQEEEAIEAIGGAEAATYGEMTPLGFRSMAERVGLCKGDVFVDLGSGLGRVVLQAAREFAVRRSIGVEYALSRHTLAEEAREASASTQSVEFIHGDCADADVWRAALHDATVMYVSNLLFGEELQERLDLLDVKYDDCVEKAELVERYKATAAQRAQEFFAGRGQASGTLY